MSISLFIQILGWMAPVVPAFLLGNVLRPFLNSYSNEKGKNLATKEDIAQLTKIAEGIRAEISDKVWDRQKQWELKRDVIQDAIRAYADLESRLVELNSWLATSEENLTDKTDSELSAAIQDFRSSRTSFRHAYLIADLAVGGRFSITMSAYLLMTGTIIDDVKLKKSFLTSAQNREFALAGKNLILSARQALGIKDAGDLAQFDDSN